MERELILSVKVSNYDIKKLEMEIDTIKKFLSYIESFSTFIASNDVFDVYKHKLITRGNTIGTTFQEGLDCTTKYYIFCKN